MGWLYTPQIVINGQKHIAGHDAAAIQSELNRQLRSGTGLFIDLDIHKSGDHFVIDVPSIGPAKDGQGAILAEGQKATLWLLPFVKEKHVSIKQGENQGRNITYYNVVKRVQALDIWDGKALQTSLPIMELTRNDVDGCAVLLQTNIGNVPGRIIGAAILPNL